MKRKTFLSLISACVVAAMCSLASCQSNQSAGQEPVYLPGRTWKFSVTHSDSASSDTLWLRVFDESRNMLQTKVEWELSIRDSASSTTVTEETGVVDNSSSPVAKNEIWIHPPRSEYLRLAEQVAFPRVVFPIHRNQVIKRDIPPKDRWDKLDGVYIKSTIAATGKILYKPTMLQDSCWKLLATGTSEAGKYSATFYYHPTKGFVYFYYDFNKYTCEVDLVSTNF